jgi:hypothetical protein
VTRRSRGRTARPTQRSTATLAGWLFADLILVLMLVMMASQPDPLANPTVAATHRASPSPSPSPSPTPTPTPAAPRTLDLKPVVIHVDGPGTPNSQIVSSIQSQLSGYQGQQAGMVLVFGDGSCIGPDTQYADTVIGLLGQVYPDADPPMFPASTVTRPFINGGDGGDCSGDSATGADLDVYYFTSAS